MAAILGFARGFLTGSVASSVGKVAAASVEKAEEGVAAKDGIVAKTLVFVSKDAVDIKAIAVAIVVPVRYQASAY